MMSLRIATRLWLLTGMSFVLFFVAIAAGLYGMRVAGVSLKTVYEENIVAMDQLARVEGILRTNRAEALLALQHDPAGRLAQLHDHPTQLHLDAIDRRVREANELWHAYAAVPASAEEEALAGDFERKRAAWVGTLDNVTAAIRAGDFGLPVLQSFLAAGSSEYQAAIDAIGKLRAYQIAAVKQEYEAAKRRYNTMLTLFAVLALSGLLALGWIAHRTQRRINGGLLEAAAVAQSIAAGDLTAALPPPRRDEIGALMGHVGAMKDSLAGIVFALRQNIETLNRSAGELAQAAAASQAGGATQSESAASMAAAVEQLSVSIDHVKDSANDAHNVSAASDDQARAGGDIIRRAAGEQGRGFAVVADEVRKLAERTGKSTEEIGAMIGKIQASMQAATAAMERGVTQVDGGVDLARQAGQSVEGIRGGAAQAMRAVEDINAALQEQSVAAREIAQRVERIAQGAEENSAAAAQTSASAQRLAGLARELETLSGRFRLA